MAKKAYDSRGWHNESERHSLASKGIPSPIYFQSCGLKSKSIDQFIKRKYEPNNTQWMLHRTEYVLSTINPRSSYGFNHKPTIQDIKNLFRNRVRGTGNFTLFKRTKRIPQMMYESWLGTSRERCEYEMLAFYEVPIEKLRRQQK